MYAELLKNRKTTFVSNMIINNRFEKKNVQVKTKFSNIYYSF